MKYGAPFFAAVGVGVLDDPGGLRWPHTTRRGEGTPPYVYSADRRRAAYPHAAAGVLRLPGKPVGIPPALRATRSPSGATRHLPRSGGACL